MVAKHWQVYMPGLWHPGVIYKGLKCLLGVYMKRWWHSSGIEHLTIDQEVLDSNPGAFLLECLLDTSE